MFLLAPPLVGDFELFSSMPDAFRRRERSAWADANRGGAVADSFLEGPVFDDAGNLYVTDIPWGRIFRIDAEIGRAHVCTPVTNAHLVCHLLLEKQKKPNKNT